MNQLIIEKDILQNNIDVIKKHIENSNASKTKPQIIAVVKGNGYGVGIETLPFYLIKNGINFFAVTEISEAIELKSKIGDKYSILVLNSTSIYDDARTIINEGFIATIGSFEALQTFSSISNELHKKVKVHLKIDTGFSRFGFSADEILSNDSYKAKLAEQILSNEFIDLEGVYTHFKESYSNDSKSTKAQFKKFQDVIKILKELNLNTSFCHCANSSAFIKYPEMHLDAVRLGSAFLGRLQFPTTLGFKRLGYLSSEILEIKEISKGSTVGYSGTYKSKSKMKIAIVGAGYADGIGVSGPKDKVRIVDKLRTIKNDVCSLFKDGNTYVKINGQKAPIVGRVGMKNFAVDIANVSCKVGDRVAIDINLLFCNPKIERTLK